MSSIKLLQVVWNFPDTVAQPFNMYYFYWPVLEAVQRGWQAEVLTFQVHPAQATEEIIDGIRVRRCPASTRKGRPFSRAFLSALLTTDADIIYCHGYGEGRSELAIFLGKLRGKQVVFAPYFHAYPYKRPLREFYDQTLGRLFCNLSDKVIVSSDYTAELLQKLGVQAQKICLLPHVSRPDVFAPRPDEQKNAFLARIGIHGEPLILCIGQFIERKGWEHTIRCLPLILKEFPKARLLILGPSQPSEPAFARRMQLLAKQLGVEHAIFLKQDNSPAFIREAYQAATVLTHPSFVESFGLVILEAMTARLPVVVHEGTGLPYLVEHKQTGYVVNVRNTGSYAEAILNLLRDPDLCQRMGNKGHEQATTRFQQSTIATHLFTLFAELLHIPYPAPLTNQPIQDKEKCMSISDQTPLLRTAQEIVRRAGRVITHPIRQSMEDVFLLPRSNKAAQVLLAMKYKQMLALDIPLPSLDEVEFRVYSQFGEDGILLYLFSLLGTVNKKCVEICGGGGYDNTANLIINHGWNGLFFEGSKRNIERGQQFYSRCADTKIWPPQLVHAWITQENINDLLTEHGYTGEIDLLSLDMDGVDYWIWKAIECVQPRVVVLEYSTLWGPEAAVTVPYRESFVSTNNSPSYWQYQWRRVKNTFQETQIADRCDNYYGASLNAFVKLGKEKGYRLIGCERYGFNAFFVRNDLGADILPEVAPAACFQHPFSQYATEIRQQKILSEDWVEV